MTDGAMSGTNTITSDVVDMLGLATGSFQMVWTGTPNGHASTPWTCEVSNDYHPVHNTAANATWTSLTLATMPTNPAGSASNTGLDLGADFPWRAVRLKYTNASSTGTLQIYFAGKGHS